MKFSEKYKKFNSLYLRIKNPLKIPNINKLCKCYMHLFSKIYLMTI